MLANKENFTRINDIISKYSGKPDALIEVLHQTPATPLVYAAFFIEFNRYFWLEIAALAS